MKNLPVYNVVPQIRSALSSNNRLVLQAPTGAGKTTAVPLALLGESWLEDKKILILEPRRLATKNAAKRMAQMLGEDLGERIGYMIRDEKILSKKTKIIVVTEGILTRMLQDDMALEDYGLIIFDEFHERNLHSDLTLALSLQAQELLREDLRLLVMSATLNTKAISTLMFDAPIIISEGRSYPVSEHYLEQRTPHPTPKTLISLMSKMIHEIILKESGSLLVFLPGVKEIKQLEAKLRETLKNSEIIIAPLYGNLDKKEQDRAIMPTKNGARKIVISTNIAESSLNIEGITVVIDSGLQRVVHFDPLSGMNKMQTVFISTDSATQRAGRAGRFEKGSCYHLWHQHKTLQKHSDAEILSSDLSPMMLELARWGIEDVKELQWLDLPPSGALSSANSLLTELSALENGKITTHGELMLKLSVHPRLAHMIIRAQKLGLGQEAVLLSALLEEKDIFRGSAKSSADLEPRFIALEKQQRAEYIDHAVLIQAGKTAQKLRKKLKLPERPKNLNHTKLGLLLAFAYPDRVAQCRDLKHNRYLLSHGKGAQLHLDDALMREPYLVISNLDAGKIDAQIYSALRLDEEDIYTHFSHQIVKERVTTFNFEAQRVEAREISKFGNIILEEKIIAHPNEEDTKRALIHAVKIKGLSTLSWSKEASALRDRITFLNHHKKETPSLGSLIPELPDLSEAWLLENLSLWLEAHLVGIKNFKGLQKLDTHSMLLGLLSWEEQQSVNTLAPSKLKVPSGSTIYLNYQDPCAPSLEVRLQELFGMSETPKLISNQFPLTIILLSPAHRPMQVTKDLKSFWENTYAEVKKELRGKYKRHYWPDDPLTAIATSKTKKNM